MGYSIKPLYINIISPELKPFLKELVAITIDEGKQIFAVKTTSDMILLDISSLSAHRIMQLQEKYGEFEFINLNLKGEQQP